MMDYPCTKFGDFNLSRFGVIVRTNTERQTESGTQTRIRTLTNWLAYSGVACITNKTWDKWSHTTEIKTVAALEL